MVKIFLIKTRKEPEIKVDGKNRILTFQLEDFEFEKKPKFGSVFKIKFNKVAFYVPDDVSTKTKKWKAEKEKFLNAFVEAEIGQRFELETNNFKEIKENNRSSKIVKIDILDFDKLEEKNFLP